MFGKLVDRFFLCYLWFSSARVLQAAFGPPKALPWGSAITFYRVCICRILCRILNRSVWGTLP